jgi:hypothetical protein
MTNQRWLRDVLQDLRSRVDNWPEWKRSAATSVTSQCGAMGDVPSGQSVTAVKCASSTETKPSR